MNRRNFLGWMGVGSLASYLPVALAATFSNTKKLLAEVANAAPVAQSDGFRRVGTVAELDQTGKLTADSVLVVRNPANPSSLSAVNPRCTHDGCTVEWKAGQKNFFCPCHDAKFAADGKVLQGPPKLPLETYETKIEGGSVLVREKARRTSQVQQNRLSDRDSERNYEECEGEHKESEQHGYS
jgi:cytochrome b6-f complex iron-sulfur subunit